MKSLWNSRPALRCVPFLLVPVVCLSVFGIAGCKSEEPAKPVDEKSIKMPTPDAAGIVPGVTKMPEEAPAPKVK